MNKSLLIFITYSLFIIPFTYIKAQDKLQSDTADYFNAGFLRYENHIYTPNIHTVQLTPLGAEMGAPLLKLDHGDQLVLSFDDLDNEAKTYSYTFIHCDANWTPSDVDKNLYIKGYTDEPLDNYRNSFNTLTKYLHYQLIFPTESMVPTVTGNYIILVYRDYDPQKIVLTRRFMIYDNKVDIDAHVHRATIIDDMKTKQKVDFSVLYEKYKIDNPFDDIKIVITQNDRWDNAITNLKPLFLKDHALDYGYDKENTFDGGNEFRFFDTRSFHFLAEHIYRFEYDSTGLHHTILEQDQRRSAHRYLTEPDINGAYLVHVEGSQDAGVDADYTTVHFSLPMSEPEANGNLYVFGGFSDWTYGDATKMKYSYDNKSYHTSLQLKQGYYNYQYVFVKDGSNAADESLIEGSHYETENDYMIYVYHRPMGSRYDMLIGVRKVNSLKG